MRNPRNVCIITERIIYDISSIYSVKSSIEQLQCCISHSNNQKAKPAPIAISIIPQINLIIDSINTTFIYLLNDNYLVQR